MGVGFFSTHRSYPRLGNEAMRTWLRREGLWPEETVKPPDPKQALHKALRINDLRPTTDVFATLAGRVGVSRCEDSAFGEFRTTLQGWFPVEH